MTTEKIENLENLSEKTHKLEEKNIMTEKEWAELQAWFDGKILRGEEY